MAESTTKLTIQAQTKGVAEAAKEAVKLADAVSEVGKTTKLSADEMEKSRKRLRAALKQERADTMALAEALRLSNEECKKLRQAQEALGQTSAVNSQKQKARLSAEEMAAASVERRKIRAIRVTEAAEAAASRAKIRAIKSEEAEQIRAEKNVSEPTPLSFGKRIKALFGFGGGRGGGSGPGGSGGSTGPGSGGFLQGFLQGVLPEAFIQRGPGALAQAGGALAGRTLRGVAGAGTTLLSSPLSGSQAAVDALAQIPFAGALAGGLRMSLSAAQGEAGAQRSLGALMPYMRAPHSGLTAASTLGYMRATSTAAGLQFGGLSRNETTAQLGQMAAAGGGYASQYSMASQRQALAAAQGFGIDTGTSGVLARGDRLGATAGGQATSTLSKAIADGISMHLEGSELTRYVQGIAGSVERFAATGIKVDEGSQGTIGRFLQRTGGYTGVRAAALSGGISETLTQVAGAGPQNAGQFALLQAAGYDPSDPESYYKAQERIDSAAPNDRARIFARARNSALGGLSGMSKYAKAAATRDILGQMGESLRIGEALKESTSGAGNISAAVRGGSTAGTDAMIEAAGSTNTFDSSRMTARMANLDSATGEKYLPSMMKMDAQARKTLNSLSTVGGKFVDFAAKVQAFGADLASTAASTLGISSSDAQVPQ